MEKITSIAWSLTPPKYTRDHLTADGKKTLCGLTIPEVVFNYDRGGFGEPCARCERKV